MAGSRNEKVGKHGEVVVSKKGAEESGDLKSWMHRNGLPPCKVVLKERPSHDEKHSPIHYVAASEDLQVKFDWLSILVFRLLFRSDPLWVKSTALGLQVGDVAFSVPDSLVVTLERVLGNETIGKAEYCSQHVASLLPLLLAYASSISWTTSSKSVIFE